MLLRVALRFGRRELQVTKVLSYRELVPEHDGIHVFRRQRATSVTPTPHVYSYEARFKQIDWMSYSLLKE